VLYVSDVNTCGMQNCPPHRLCKPRYTPKLYLNSHWNIWYIFYPHQYTRVFKSVRICVIYKCKHWTIVADFSNGNQPLTGSTECTWRWFACQKRRRTGHVYRKAIRCCIPKLRHIQHHVVATRSESQCTESVYFYNFKYLQRLGYFSVLCRFT